MSQDSIDYRIVRRPAWRSCSVRGTDSHAFRCTRIVPLIFAACIVFGSWVEPAHAEDRLPLFLGPYLCPRAHYPNHIELGIGAVVLPHQDGWVLLEATPGYAGTRLCVGYERHLRGRFDLPPLLSVSCGLRASFLGAWTDVEEVRASQDYLGVEVEVGLGESGFGWDLLIGYHWPMDESEPDAQPFFSAALGWRFMMM